MQEYGGNSCSRASFLFYTFYFWLNGFALLIFGIWWLIDPARFYALNIVDFSEDIPLLKFAIYGLLGVGGFTLFNGFVGCLGALKSERCLVGSFPSVDSMSNYLANISQNRYYRDKWVLPLMDSIQFYQQCCGGNGPKDYLNSFWYLTNTERGTRSFVPHSCCRQSQNGRAWDIISIDPMCTTYSYYSKSFNDSINIRGCGEPMKKWSDKQTLIFSIVLAGTAITDIIGICISSIYMSQISGYYFIH